MTDSPQIPPPINPQRSADGKLLPGAVINPTGANGHMKGWQPIGIRLQKWLNMSAVEVSNLHASDADLTSLSMIDAMCIKLIATGFTAAPKEMVKIFKEITDRVEGTPRQTITVTSSRPDMPENVQEMTDEQINEAFRARLIQA